MPELNIRQPLPEVDTARLRPHLRGRAIAKPTRCSQCRKQSATVLCANCRAGNEAG